LPAVKKIAGLESGPSGERNWSKTESRQPRPEGRTLEIW